MVVDLIRSRVMLEAEIWTLRQQINVLRRTAPKKLSFYAVDRMIFVGLYRLFPKICDGQPGRTNLGRPAALCPVGSFASIDRAAYFRSTPRHVSKVPTGDTGRKLFEDP